MVRCGHMSTMKEDWGGSKKDSKIDFDNNEYDRGNTIGSGTSCCTSVPQSPPPRSTKDLSKSARNRIYAQTSRARHRAYVSNLERERQDLLARLDRIEEENRRMRGELNELRRHNKRTKTSDGIAGIKPISESKPSSFNQHDDPSTQYALSVLASSNVTNLPRPSLFEVLNSPLFSLLVAVTKENNFLMNWKGSYCGVKDHLWMGKRRSQQLNLLMPHSKTSSTSQNSTLFSLLQRHHRMKLLEMIKLAKLKIYLQQFGK